MTIHLPATGVRASAPLKLFPAEGLADSQNAGATAFQAALEECQQSGEAEVSPTEAGFANGRPQQRRNPTVNGEKSEEPVTALIAAMAGLASPQVSLASAPKPVAADQPDADKAKPKSGIPEGVTPGFVEQALLSSVIPAEAKSVAAADQPDTAEKVNPKAGISEGATPGFVEQIPLSSTTPAEAKCVAAAGRPDMDKANSKSETPESVAPGFVEQIPLSSAAPAEAKSVTAADQPDTDEANPKSETPEGTTPGFVEQIPLSSAAPVEAKPVAAADRLDTDKANPNSGTPKNTMAGFCEQIPLSSTMPTEAKSVAAADQPDTDKANLKSGTPEVATPGFGEQISLRPTAVAPEFGEPAKTKQIENDAPTWNLAAGEAVTGPSKDAGAFVPAVPGRHDSSPSTTRLPEKVAVSGVRPGRGSRPASKDSADRTRDGVDPNVPVFVAAPSRLPVPPEPAKMPAGGQEAGPTPGGSIPTPETADKRAGVSRESGVASNAKQTGGDPSAELTAAVRASDRPAAVPAAHTTEMADSAFRTASVPRPEETRRAAVERTIPDAAVQNVRSSQFAFRETVAGNPKPAAAPEGAVESARTLESQGIIEPAATTAPRRPTNGLLIELGQGTRERVALHVTERAGEVRVAVRAADPELAQNIRQSLPELVSHLEQSGFRAEGWHPAAAVGPTQAASRPEFQETRNGDSQQQQPGWSQQDRGQRGQEQGHRPRWVEELESTRTSAGSGSTGEWNGFGN